MARAKRIWISALNIKIHPHSPGKYIELFKDAYKLEKSVRLRADDYGIIGWMRFLNTKNPLEGITGELYKYLELDPDKPWLNVEEHKKAEPSEILDIQIPDHMKPNMTAFRFVFFPKGHRLFFEFYSDGNRIGPTLVKKLFEGLFSHDTIKQKYGDVDVILEPSREKLEEILSIYNLKQLQMRITKPNPDDPDEFEHKVFERMELENVDSFDYNLRGKFIDPDQETKLLARVAASNGYVKGLGRDEEDRRTEESTVDHPLQDRVDYDPDIESPSEVFRYKAARMFDSIAAWLRGE